jgi:hypothetical protein
MEFRCALETWRALRKSAKAVLLLAIRVVAITAERFQSPGTWSTTGSLKNARSGHIATLLVAGGSVGSNDLASVRPRKRPQGATSSMSTARAAHTATLLPDNRVLVAGGEAFINGSPVIFSSAELCNPSTGTWSKTSSMSVAREQQTRLLPNGPGLVGGVSHRTMAVSSRLPTPPKSTRHKWKR